MAAHMTMQIVTDDAEQVVLRIFTYVDDAPCAYTDFTSDQLSKFISHLQILADRLDLAREFNLEHREKINEEFKRAMEGSNSNADAAQRRDAEEVHIPLHEQPGSAADVPKT